MEEKAKVVEMPVHHIDKVALQCMQIVTTLHAMTNIVIEGEEKAEMAKKELPTVITNAINRISELCSIATIVCKGEFKVHDDDEEAEEPEAGREPFKLED